MLWQGGNKLVVKFGQTTPKMAKAEGVAKRIVSDMVAFRPYIPIVRSFCNPGLKSRHLD